MAKLKKSDKVNKDKFVTNLEDIEIKDTKKKSLKELFNFLKKK